MKDVNILTNNGVNVSKSLELFGEMSMYEDTLHDFLDGVNEKVAKLKNFKELGDMPNYAIEAHSLKSDAKYLGFTKLAEIAYQHELEGKANNRHFVNEHCEELLKETTRMVDVVNNYFNSNVSNNAQQASSDESSNVTLNHGKAILVVDDSNIVRNFIEKIFSNNYDIIVASDGAKAIDIVKNDQSSSIVAMLLDLNMPNVSGFEVLEYFSVNNLFTKIPVSIITGEDSKEKINETFKYPIVDVIVKPFNEANIKAVVEKTINFK